MLEKVVNLPVHHDGSARHVEWVAERRVVLWLLADPGAGVTAVHARVTSDGEPHHHAALRTRCDSAGEWWRVEVPVVNDRTRYRFVLETAAGGAVLNQAGLFDRDVSEAADFRLTSCDAVPEWVRDGVVYQVFCDRFAPGGVDLPLPEWAVAASWEAPVASDTPDGVRQLYGGTLWGVLDRLEHLERLGVDVLYLTPFFPARSNHRYDSTTFDHVDPLLGGDQALLALCTEARRRGIRVIGDLTLNHTGDGHEWFRRACEDPDSPEAAFYLFDPEPSEGPGYACFWGVPSLPKLDHRSAELRHRLYGGPDSVVARYVRDFGLSGWRIDVAQSAGIHGPTDMNGEVAALTRATLAAVDPEAYLVAETNHDPTGSLQGGGWQGVMAYAAFTRPVWGWLGQGAVERQWGVPVHFPVRGADAMVEQMVEFGSQVPWDSRVASLNLLDSHDTARFHTVAGPAAQELATALMVALPGVPMLFSGDEYGVDGTGLEDSRRPFPWHAPRDERLFEAHRRLLALRRQCEPLRRGGLRWLDVQCEAVVLERATRTDRVVVRVAVEGAEGWLTPWPLESLLDGSTVSPGESLSGAGYGFWRVLD